MNLRLEHKDIRIRLTENEWLNFVEVGQLHQQLDVGFCQDLIVRLSLADHNAYCSEGFEVQIRVAKASLQKPIRKKDPYWNYIDERGLRLSLDVDIIPEEKR